VSYPCEAAKRQAQTNSPLVHDYPDLYQASLCPGVQYEWKVYYYGWCGGPGCALPDWFFVDVEQ